MVRSRARLEARLGARLILAAVCDRHARRKVRGIGLPRGTKILADWREAVRDPAVDVVVELIGGRTEARELVLESLRRGKDVVTANKALLSQHWVEIHRLAGARGLRVGLEASVAGGIPILGPLAQELAANRVRQVLGILNGTTNFILTRMVHDRLDLRSSLREAQRRGLAERDPTLDLDGTDTAHKLSIVASIILGSWLPPSAIAREGIAGLRLEDVQFALAELGRTVRLLGVARFEGGPSRTVVEARVHPVLVPVQHPLASVHDAYNAVMVETTEAQDLMFYGLGAGPGPAASAVVADVLAVARARVGGGGPAPKAGFGAGRVRVRPPAESVGRFYLRFDAQDRPGVLGRIAAGLGREGVSIGHVVQRARGDAGRGPVPVVLVTHPAREGSVLKAVRAVAGRGGVRPRVTLLRML